MPRNSVAGDPCVRDDAVLDLTLDAQVTFDSGERIDDDVGSHYLSPPFLARLRS